MLVPEMLPGSSFPPLLLQQLDRSADHLWKMILAFFPLWLLLLLPEPSRALLGGAGMILFWESGQYGPPSAQYLLPGLWISSPAPTSCLYEVQNASPGLVWTVAFGSGLPSNSPLPYFTNRHHPPTAITNLRSQLWDLTHPLQTHAYPRGAGAIAVVEEPFHICSQSILQFHIGNALHKTFVHPMYQVPEQKDLELTMIGRSSSLIKKCREAGCLGNQGGSKMSNVVVQINRSTRNEHRLCRGKP